MGNLSGGHFPQGKSPQRHPEIGASGISTKGGSNDFNNEVADIDVAPVFDGEVRDRELARVLRAWFDCLIEAMSPEVLALVREQCLRTARTAANVEIVATIDRRMAQLRACPPRES
jgi:hypothetical protein